MKNYYNIVEVLVAVVCVDEGNLKVLLRKKQTEPYKGYWIMPSNFLTVSETLEDCVNKIIENSTGVKKMFFKQSNVLSNLDRDSNNRILAIPYLAITTKENILFHAKTTDYSLFDIKSLPKLGYDHNLILDGICKEIIELVKSKENNIIYNLFSSDFTLPELQRFFENILNKKIDRRNFRKKLIVKKMIEDTGYKNDSGMGRPSELYRFTKKEVKESAK